MTGKTLEELRTEIELGLTVYHSTNPDIQVSYDASSYGYSVSRGDTLIMACGYGTFEELLAYSIMPFHNLYGVSISLTRK